MNSFVRSKRTDSPSSSVRLIMACPARINRYPHTHHAVAGTRRSGTDDDRHGLPVSRAPPWRRDRALSAQPPVTTPSGALYTVPMCRLLQRRCPCVSDLIPLSRSRGYGGIRSLLRPGRGQRDPIRCLTGLPRITSWSSTRRVPDPSLSPGLLRLTARSPGASRAPFPCRGRALPTG